MWWVVGYLGVGLATVLVINFLTGRADEGREVWWDLSPALTVFWPLMLPCVAVLWLADKAQQLGERTRK